MKIDVALRGIAGVFVLASVALGYWVSPWFYAFTAFVGLNLLQSAFTGWCPMMWVLGKAGLVLAPGTGFVRLAVRASMQTGEPGRQAPGSPAAQRLPTA